MSTGTVQSSEFQDYLFCVPHNSKLQKYYYVSVLLLSAFASVAFSIFTFEASGTYCKTGLPFFLRKVDSACAITSKIFYEKQFCAFQVIFWI